MKITFDWLKEHLKINSKEKDLLEQLTNIGLEVETVENLSSGIELFKIAKVIKTEKHPNADRLKICDVDIGKGELKKVVCGAPNAREGLITIYAPPGAVIPKTQTKLVVAKIRDVISYGMLCSESELNLSDESEGIVELSTSKYQKKIGHRYFSESKTFVAWLLTNLLSLLNGIRKRLPSTRLCRQLFHILLRQSAAFFDCRGTDALARFPASKKNSRQSTKNPSKFSLSQRPLRL